MQTKQIQRNPNRLTARRVSERHQFRIPNSEFHTPTRSAFTLVEMLIAVALVVLMMTLFATIFQIATGAMATQKGLAENDQRVRLVLNRLRNDLNGFTNDSNDPGKPYRTFRKLIPYGPGEDVLSSNFSSTDRNGYFYISENDPDDDTDDVLSLTVQFPATASDQFFGQAAVLLPDVNNNLFGYSVPAGNSPNPGSGYPPAGTASVPIAAAPPSGQSYWPNQPDFDDILGIPNKVGNSQSAEVTYFLRRGTLYRRVLLIRSPGVDAADGTPSDTSNIPLSMVTYSGGSRAFWNDFDYSAYFDQRAATPKLRFHGTSDGTHAMGSEGLKFTGGVTNPFSLANPAYRFGFDCTFNAAAGTPAISYGQPREYVTTTANQTYFIGRFTHSETSDLAFDYPGTISATSPMNSATKLNYDTGTGRVGPGASFFRGPRSGEDILMTNVIKFDIKVFDPAASVGPDGAYGVAGVDDDGDGITDNFPELGWPGSDDGDFRDIGHLGSTGYYASFASALVADTSLDPSTGNSTTNRTWGPTNTPVTSRVQVPNPPPAPLAGNYNSFTKYTYPNTNYGYGNGASNYGNVSANIPPLAPFANRYDTWHTSLNLDNNFDASGNPIFDSPPFRPFNFGTDGRPGKANFDDDGNGQADYVIDPVSGFKVPDPREIGWPGTDDQPVPLSAIQIKITFFDATSNQIREVTLVQSLLYIP